MNPNMTADEIYDIEERDDLIRIMAHYMGHEIDPGIRRAIKERVLYFFGITI